MSGNGSGAEAMPDGTLWISVPVGSYRIKAKRRPVGSLSLARHGRGRDLARGGAAQVVVELLDEAALRQDDDHRAGDDQRGREQDPERQQQPRPKRQAQSCQAASARSV